MNKKLVGAILSVTLLFAAAGAGTMAWFTSQATSSNNTFQAGILRVDNIRNDIPITGPMFYTESNEEGMQGTGYWEPGKGATRMLLVTNTGNLPTRLEHLQAQLVNENEFSGEEGQLIKSKFLNDMRVQTRWTTSAVRNNHDYVNINVFISALKEAQEQFDLELKGELAYETDEFIANRMDEIFHAKLDPLSVRFGGGGTDHIIHGEQKLSNYINGYTTPATMPTLQPGESMAIVYYARMASSDNQNILQGQSLDFNFTHTFGQIK